MSRCSRLSIVLARLVPASWVVGGSRARSRRDRGRRARQQVLPEHLRLVSRARTILPSLGTRLSFPLGYWNGLGIEVALAYPLLLAIMISQTLASRERRGRIPAADSRRGHVSHLVTRRVRRRRSGGAGLRRAHPEALGGSGGSDRRGRRRCGRGRRARAQEGTRQREDGHRARRASGPPRGAPDRRRLCRDGARLGRARRAREAAADAAASRRGGSRRRGRRPRRRRHRRQRTRCGSSTSSRALWPRPARTGTSRRTICSAAPAAGAGSSGARRSPSSGPIHSTAAEPAPGRPGGSSTARCPVPSEFAHSLYLEALAELGIVGLLLIGGAVLVAVVGAIRSALALQSGEIAAAAACGIAFFAAAAYDWVWQLAGIAVVGVGMLGFAVGALPAERAGAWGRFGTLRPLIALLAVAAIIPQYVVLAAGSHLRNSQDAFNAGNGAASTVGGSRGQGDRAMGGQPVSAARFRRRGRGALDRCRALGARSDPALETGLEPVGQRSQLRNRGRECSRRADAISPRRAASTRIRSCWRGANE